MTRAGRRVKVGTGVRLADRVGIGVLTAAFPSELVDLAIEEWDAREERHRMLPARVMAYFTMACSMYFDDEFGRGLKGHCNPLAYDRP